MFVINDVKWYLKFVPEYHPMLYRDDFSLSIGSCDNEEKTIYINQNLRGKKLKKVLCHEITHAAMFSYNVYLTLEQEELFADLISSYGEEIINITNRLFGELL